MANDKRPPLDLSTRMTLAIEMLTDYPNRKWGQASQLAKAYGISRTWLYELGKKAKAALTDALEPKPPGPKPKPKKNKAAAKRRRRLGCRRRKDLQEAKREKKHRQRRRDRRRNAFMLMKKRRRIVNDYLARRATVCESMAAGQTAERFGFGVSTIRRWAQNYRRHGKRGLIDQVRHGVRSPSKLSSVVVGFIVLLRTRLGWGAQRIAAELNSKGIANISHQTVHRAFKKYHLRTKTYHPKGKSNGIRYKRYRKRAPNQMWHLDFAGPFQVADGQVYVLLVIDDSSRFALALEVLDSQKTEAVKMVLENLFHQYGTPAEIMTDNAPTFTSVKETENHPFFVFLTSHQVVHQLTPPYYPQSNGKVEALVKTTKRECLRHLDMASTRSQALRRHLEQFLEYYNWHRLHSGLSYDVPSAFYCGVRLESSFSAIPQFLGICLPMSATPEKTPRIDVSFIHRHTALVAISIS